MEVVLAQMDSFCTTGRASQLGCYVQTISWTNGVRDNENFQVMNGYIEEAAVLTQRSSSTAIQALAELVMFSWRILCSSYRLRGTLILRP